MSYCRFSSDNFGCDLYCYESNGGYVIHVAENRIIGKIPKIDIGLLTSASKKLTVQYKKQSKFLETAKRKKIGLSSDGKTFTFESIYAFIDKLLDLREEGYNFPDYVLDEIEQEIEEKTKTL